MHFLKFIAHQNEYGSIMKYLTNFGVLFLLLSSSNALLAQNAGKIAQGDAGLIAQGKTLFQIKICFTCHQSDPAVPAPAGEALKATKFIGDFWGKEREVQINADPQSLVFKDSGKTEKVKLDEAYFLESVEKPMAKIFKGAVPGMAPLPTTPEERNALLAYVKSLSKAGGSEPIVTGQPTPKETPKEASKPEGSSAAALDPAQVNKGEELFKTKACFACHGPEGEGNKALNAPRIAGQGSWYLERQLKNFKAGIRGANINDTPHGKLMQAQAMTLLDEDQDIADVAAYISSMNPEPPTTEITGNVEEGKAAYRVCQDCHGSKGEGSKDLNAPKLVNQHDWYLIRQLNSFKEGLRGTHHEDIYGMQMRPMSENFPDDETITNLVSYIATLKPDQPTPDTPYLPTMLISVVTIIGLTLVGLKSGTKEVEVR